jgi:hypothetical protein
MPLARMDAQYWQKEIEDSGKSLVGDQLLGQLLYHLTSLVRWFVEEGL